MSNRCDPRISTRTGLSQAELIRELPIAGACASRGQLKKRPASRRLTGSEPDRRRSSPPRTEDTRTAPGTRIFHAGWGRRKHRIRARGESPPQGAGVRRARLRGASTESVLGANRPILSRCVSAAALGSDSAHRKETATTRRHEPRGGNNRLPRIVLPRQPPGHRARPGTDVAGRLSRPGAPSVAGWRLSGQDEGHHRDGGPSGADEQLPLRGPAVRPGRCDARP